MTDDAIRLREEISEQIVCPENDEADGGIPMAVTFQNRLPMFREAIQATYFSVIFPQ